MKRNKIAQYTLAAIFGLFTLNTAMAQQVSVFNLNTVNPFLVNPSKAGESGNQAYLYHRNQWLGVMGAPQTSILTVEFRVPESRSAIGLHIANDQAGILKTTTAYATYAYHLKFSDNQSLSFGVSAGMRQNTLLFERAIVLNPDDQILFSSMQSGASFDANAGLTYKLHNFEAQFSAMQLLATKNTFSNNFDQKELNYRFIQHYVGSVGYTLWAKKNVRVTPMLQLRNVQGLNIQPEGIVKVSISNWVQLGVKYNHQRSIAASAAFLVNNRFTIGYAGELATNSYIAQNFGSHELIFGFKFGQAAPAMGNSGATSSNSKSVSNKEYEERLNFLNQENKKMQEELEKQRAKLAELELKSKSMDYAAIKKALEDAKNATVESEKAAKEVAKEEVKKKLESKSASIQFEEGSDKLTAASLPALDEIAQFMKENPDATLAIGGYTDNSGNPQNNQILSQKRADTVKNYLVSKGVQTSRVNAVGYGDQNPISPNNTPENRAKNRRTELKISF